MFRTPRIWLGLQVARFRFRKAQEPIIAFTNALSSAHHALLIMPLNRAQRFPAVSVMEMLTKRFAEENITIITAEDDYQTARLLPHSPQVRLLVNEFNLFYLPHHDLIERIGTHQYDIAIDLNLDFVLPSAYICKASKARVRVGFTRKHSEKFYNLTVRLDPTLDPRGVYDRLVKCLQMF